MKGTTILYSGRFILVAAVVFSSIVLLTVPVTAASWNISTVDGTGTEVSGSSLVLDTLGNPHVAYFSDSGLMYAVWNGSGWTEETVTMFTFGGEDPTLVLDSSGYPHIAYADLDSFSIRYAEYNGTEWTFETVDSSATVAGFVSFALDASNTPHVSYYDVSVRDLKYAVRDGLVWENETVDSSGFWPEGQYNSLAVNASGYPCISYLGYANDNLKYAAWDGSVWRIEIVDSESDVGQCTSLALDVAGRPHISYQNGGDSDLKYAAWDGSAWSVESVGSSSQFVSGGTSLALDASGNPHIAYGANSGLQYAVWNGSVWTFETVDSYGSLMSLWLHVDASLVLDASGYPHILYANKTLEDLMYAVQGEAPSADFIGTPTSGTAPVTVTFTDTSTNADAWDWTFGDGTCLQEHHPVHTYNGSGIYTVTLAVANSFGTDALTRSSYITVAPSAVAFSPDRAMVNTTVNGILTGTGFVDGMAVALVGTGFPAINATNVNVTGETTLSCTFNLTGALDGLRDIQVTSPEGLSGILVDGFAVTIPSPVSLSAGWNMISVPVENATITLPPEAGPIYRYNGNIYESVPDLAGVSPGEGLWIAATGPCTLTFTGTALDTYTVPASAGWNMIGSCSSEIEPFLDHLVSDPAGALNTQIYTYDPAEGRYVTPTSCTPGCGYWASVTTVCILHFC